MKMGLGPVCQVVCCDLNNTKVGILHELSACRVLDPFQFTFEIERQKQFNLRDVGVVAAKKDLSLVSGLFDLLPSFFVNHLQKLMS